jgi:hypothetical protein
MKQLLNHTLPPPVSPTPSSPPPFPSPSPSPLSALASSPPCPERIPHSNLSSSRHARSASSPSSSPPSKAFPGLTPSPPSCIPRKTSFHLSKEPRNSSRRRRRMPSFSLGRPRRKKDEQSCRLSKSTARQLRPPPPSRPTTIREAGSRLPRRCWLVLQRRRRSSRPSPYPLSPQTPLLLPPAGLSSSAFPPPPPRRP